MSAEGGVPANEINFFLDGHFGDEIVDAFFNCLRVIADELCEAIEACRKEKCNDNGSAGRIQNPTHVLWASGKERLYPCLVCRTSRRTDLFPRRSISAPPNRYVLICMFSGQACLHSSTVPFAAFHVCSRIFRDGEAWMRHRLGYCGRLSWGAGFPGTDMCRD